MIQSPAFRGTRLQKISSGGGIWRVGWVGGVGGGGMVGDCDMGGPVQIACLGVEPNECSTQLVATAVKERPPQPNCSSRIYPSMFHFVITGVIGF